MKSLYLLNDILSRKFKSISWINKIDLPETDFSYEKRLDLLPDEAYGIINNILQNVQIEGAQKDIPICHATYFDNSEQDLWVNFGTNANAVLLLEISHSYIDQHFLQFQLWDTDHNLEPNYPVDALFESDVLQEKPKGLPKIGRLLVKPVALSIHASNIDLSPYLPTNDALAGFESKAQSLVTHRFWKSFEEHNYQEAAKTILQQLQATKELLNVADTYSPFMHSILAICEYLSSEFLLAAEHFTSSGKEYYQLEFMRNADACFFYAIEAGRNLSDINKAFVVANSIIDDLPFIAKDYKGEITNILRSYYSGVYVGTAVLCRRVIELYLAQLLEAKFGKPVSKLVKEAKVKGEIPKKIGPGLYVVLELAKIRDIITNQEYLVASHIKDFGNSIHDRGGVNNAVDAKYAIQSCLHLLHRIR